jgi:acyl transferase domain-containing protein/NADPH:quinone reductase-like Zn-dependent oxidoreductase/NAD(P)-dependent dehydrogenase (short-subunit alcohol dehydrogenase family)/SAM-dependent methyltransferase
MSKEQRDLSILKQAYIKIEELQARLDAIGQAKREPLAIIGMACRFPGEANDPAAFWQLLRNGRDTVTEIPADRWDVDAYFDPDRSKPGKMYMRRGAFLQQVDQFDPQFFGISPREAVKMDPQQRLLLEVCWEALENAGVAPDRLSGSRTGTFIGLCKGDYRQILAGTDDPHRFDAYYISGTANSIASGRLSYILGLQGPSITVDTACSSSLVALHLGCQSLRSGECAMTLVAGVNLILSPENTITYCKCSMMAADGRCKTFDDSADGFVQGEGCGVVVLKRLTAAVADGNRILAVIRGTAVNQDGPSSGLTAPHGPSQVAVIREALANSGVNPSEVQYVEAHGTGTSLGDPIEVQAIGAALRKGRAPDQPVLIGSVKTNIGHLEAAAGIAGLIKVVLALQHKEIPAHLHCKTLNSYIPWSELPVKVATEHTAWVASDGKRIAGVSSFGFSGTNAHAILEEAPALNPAVEEPRRPIHVLALSAKNEAALKSLSGKFAEFLATDPSVSVSDFCFTANAGRAHFGQRLAIVAESMEPIREKLVAAAAGEAPFGILTGHRENTDRPKIAFLFTGQGSQYQGMGRRLYDTEPGFRLALDRCDELLRPYLPHPLLSVLYHEPGVASLLAETEYTQPALFSLEYALAKMWISWGIVPDVVLGHSLGEYVAACIAGVFGPEDGIKLVAERGRLVKTLCPRGAMAALFAEEERVRVALLPYADDVSIAAINGPKHVVISGAKDAVGALLKDVESQGIMGQTLAVSHAFHSQLIEPMLDAFATTAAKIAYASPRMGLVSNVTGELVKPAEIASAGYWLRHLSEPVRFSSSIATLFAKGYELFVEVGPTPTLSDMGKRCVPTGAGTWVPSLRKGRDDWQQILESLGTLYTRGAQVDWVGFDSAYPRRRLSLPTYPFQRKRYWIAEQKARATHDSPRHTGRHPLLEQRTSSPLFKDTIFESRFSLRALPFLDEHRVFGMAVLPAAAYLEMVNAAATEALGVGRHTLENIDFREALSLQNEETRTVQLILSPAEQETLTFQVLSFVPTGLGDKAPFTLHAAGNILARQEITTPSPAAGAFAELKGRCPHEAPVSEYYRRLDTMGIQLGNRFRGVEKLWRGNNEALGLIKLTPDAALEANGYTMHPAMLDACLQIFGAAIFSEAELEAGGRIFLPMAIERFTLYRCASSELWSHVTIAPRPEATSKRDTIVGDMHVFDISGELVAELRGLHLKRAEKDPMRERARPNFVDWFYEVAWQAQPLVCPVYSASAGFLPAPAEIGARVTPSLARSGAANWLGMYEKFLPQLDQLCAAYILRALEQLGWQPRLYERITVASLAARLGVVNSHHRLLNRFLLILQEEGILKPAGSGWEVSRLPEATDLEKERRELLVRFPGGEAELTLVKRGGENLASALCGGIDPAQLLFPDGSFDMADKLYRESLPAKVFNTLMRESVAAALARLPADRAIRVLEIGAGTGGTSAFVLANFPPECTEYIFTDLSQFFLSKAKERFKSYPFLRYEILNIERNPSVQGFAPHQFDLIIAAGVLHATADLRQTLAHVKQLLAPEGILMLLEVTRPQRWIDLSFGLTEGWWLFTDVDLRPSYPLLTQDGWKALLDDTGFSEALTIPEQDTGSALAQNALILARAPKIDGVDEIAASGGRWLVFADGGGVGERLGEFLQARNETAIVVTPGEAFAVSEPGRFTIDPTCAEDFQRLIREVCGDGQPPCRGAVHLWSLDDMQAERMKGSELVEAQKLGTRSVLYLVQALATAGPQSPQLWLVTRGAQPVGDPETPLVVAHAPLWGMAKAIDLEHPELQCVCVDLDPAQAPRAAAGQSARALLDEISCPNGESQIAFRNNQRYVGVLARCSGRNGEGERHANGSVSPSLQLVVTRPGILDSLQLQPAERRLPGPGEVEICVQAAGLNFRDVLNALGMRSDGELLGGECTGTVVAVGEGVTDYSVGDEVIAVAPGSLSTFVVAHTLLVVPKPKHVGFAEAAACPLVFLTAHFALHTLGRMQRGERLLIHSAAGGVGQAAVQLAQRAGLEIFATAGTPEKREFLRSLGIRHVMHSRSVDFAEEIMRITDGEGVDLVLNSLTGPAIPNSLRLLRKGGRFLEIGKAEIWDLNRVAEVNLKATYHAIDLSKTLQSDPLAIRQVLVQLIAELADGALKPPPISVFAFEDGPNAFRYMAQARHIGKVVLTQDAEARRPGMLDQGGTYLVTGGLRGLGLLTAEWLVQRGARHLLLIGRNPTSAHTAETLRRLEAAGVEIRTMQGDVSIEQDIRSIFDEAQRTMPPLRGVIHAAGTLADGVLLQQDWARFREVMASKIAGAWHLHNLTKELPLDFFVLFSSIAAILGAAGQANHAAANSFMDALAHHRRRLGLPASSINWGVWSEVGAAAERNVDVRALAQGMGAFSPQQGLQVLEYLLAHSPTQIAVMVVNWSKFLSKDKSDRRRHFFSAVVEGTALQTEVVQSHHDNIDFRLQLEQTSPKKRHSLLLEYVREQAIKVLSLDPTQPIDPKLPLTSLGLDSLMAVELRNLLGSGLSLTRNFPATLVFDYPTLAALTGYLAKEVFGWNEAAQKDAARTGEDGLSDLLENLEDLSEQEVDRLFAERTERQ